MKRALAYGAAAAALLAPILANAPAVAKLVTSLTRHGETMSVELSGSNNERVLPRRPTGVERQTNLADYSPNE